MVSGRDKGDVKMNNEKAIKLIKSWLGDESGEQEKSWEIAKQAIEDNRMSDRLRFEEEKSN